MTAPLSSLPRPCWCDPALRSAGRTGWPWACRGCWTPGRRRSSWRTHTKNSRKLNTDARLLKFNSCRLTGCFQGGRDDSAFKRELQSQKAMFVSLMKYLIIPEIIHSAFIQGDFLEILLSRYLTNTQNCQINISSLCPFLEKCRPYLNSGQRITELQWVESAEYREGRAVKSLEIKESGAQGYQWGGKMYSLKFSSIRSVSVF